MTRWCQERTDIPRERGREFNFFSKGIEFRVCGMFRTLMMNLEQNKLEPKPKILLEPNIMEGNIIGTKYYSTVIPKL